MNKILEITNKLDFKRSIYIYGAGKYGRFFCEFIENVYDAHIEGFIVTELENNISASKRIYEFSEFCNKENVDSQIVVAIKGLQKEIRTLLKNNGFENVYALSDGFFEDYQSAYFYANIKKVSSCDFSLVYDCSRIEPYHVLIEHRRVGLSPLRVSFCANPDKVRKKVEEYDTGKIKNELLKFNRNYISEKGCVLKKEALEKLSTEIYKVTSASNRNLAIGVEEDETTLIIAGCNEVKEGVLCDGTGDNISLRNSDYSEASALYWIWKNTLGQKYVGLCHYRRKMKWFSEMLEDIKNESIDVVITPVQFSLINVKDFFLQLVQAKDWELFKKYVSEYGKEYREVFEKYEESCFYVPCNIVLMKRSIFDDYCEFAFGVSEKIYQYYNERNIIRNDRYMGYLFENLLSIYLIVHQNLNIGVTDMVFIK